ncbi:MAG: zinc ribbon domain-containing protein [Oscillospiraceae bacterium]|nr:zinc ribbon domain-containing protein [Oscillospiraceae bacterium]
MSAFDEIFDKVRTATNAAGKKTGEFVEIQKAKLQLYQRSLELNAVYEKLGNSVYNMVKADYNDAEVITKLVNEIDGVKKEIEDLNEKIADLKNQIICEGCGKNNPSDYGYCYACGKKLPRSQTSDSGMPF